MSIPDWAVRHPSDQAKIDAGYTFDESLGQRVIDFIPKYVVLEGGSPCTVLPYQVPIIHSWYSWVRPQDGYLRATKTGLLTMGRKNAKTYLGSSLCLNALLNDDAVEPSIVSVAIDSEQAGQVFDTIKRSYPNISKYVRLTEGRRLVRTKTGQYKTLTSDPGGAGKFGRGHDFVLIDEMALWRPSHEGIWTALKDSGKSKPNSMRVIISTAGWNPNSAFKRLVDYGRKVMSGEIIDLTFQPWIFETDNPDAHDLNDRDTLIEVARQSNPALGVTQSIHDFVNDWNFCRHSVAEKLAFYRLSLNSWTAGSAGWLPTDRWDASKLSADKWPCLDHAPVHIGIDAGGLSDWFSIACVFTIAGKYYVKSYNYVPKAAADKRLAKGLTEYERFKLDGSLRIIPGDAVGIEQDIYPLINRLIAQHDVKSLVVDKWQLRQLTQHYQPRMPGKVFEFIPDNAHMNDPCKSLERALLAGKIVTDGSAAMRWQVGHTELSRNERGYVKPVTPCEDMKKDCIDALVFAFSQATIAPSKPAYQNVYKGRGIIWA